MDVRYLDGVDDEEKREVEAWVERVTRPEMIGWLVVGRAAVVVHGVPGQRNAGKFGLSSRYPGRLSAALDDALEDLVGQP